MRLWLESGSFGGVMWSMSMIRVGKILEVWTTGDKEAKNQRQVYRMDQVSNSVRRRTHALREGLVQLVEAG